MKNQFYKCFCRTWELGAWRKAPSHRRLAHRHGPDALGQSPGTARQRDQKGGRGRTKKRWSLQWALASRSRKQVKIVSFLADLTVGLGTLSATCVPQLPWGFVFQRNVTLIRQGTPTLSTSCRLMAHGMRPPRGHLMNGVERSTLLPWDPMIQGTLVDMIKQTKRKGFLSTRKGLPCCRQRLMERRILGWSLWCSCTVLCFE